MADRGLSHARGDDITFSDSIPSEKAVALFRWHTVFDIRPKAMVHPSTTLPTAETARSALPRPAVSPEDEWKMRGEASVMEKSSLASPSVQESPNPAQHYIKKVFIIPNPNTKPSLRLTDPKRLPRSSHRRIQKTPFFQPFIRHTNHQPFKHAQAAVP